MQKHPSVQDQVGMLIDEINGPNRIDVINNLEMTLSKDISALSKCETFFNIPLKHIFAIISKVDFRTYDDSNGDVFNMLHCLIANTVAKHPNEEELLLVMKYIDTRTITLSEDQYVSLMSQFKDYPFLQTFCSICQERLNMPNADQSYELQQKKKEVEDLKQKIQELDPNNKYKVIKQFPELTEVPDDLELNIIKACELGKLSSVRWLIEKEHIHPSITDEKKDSLLHIAAKVDSFPIVQYLVEKLNFKIDIKGDLDKTPLYTALENGHIQIAQYLIAKGADLNIKDKNGDIAIHFAIVGGLLPMVQYFIEKKNIDIDLPGQNKTTPLIYACSFGKLQIAEYLISKGANMNAQDCDGCTPFHAAAFCGLLPIVKKFVEERNENVDTLNFNGMTPLILACIANRYSVAEYLISKGANVNIMDNYGRTPFLITCRQGSLELFELLTSKCEGLNFGSLGENALNYAIENINNPQILRDLVEKYKLDINSPGICQLTPLMHAIAVKNVPAAKYLIDNGADLNAFDSYGHTALYYAVHCNVIEISQYIREHIEKQNQQNDDQMTHDI